MSIKLLLLLLLAGIFAEKVPAGQHEEYHRILELDIPEAGSQHCSTVVISDDIRERAKQHYGIRIPGTVRKIVFMTDRPGGPLTAACLDTVSSKYGTVAFCVVMDDSGRILNVALTVTAGTRDEGLRNPAFLAQFRGKTADDRLRVFREIDGVSGATASSRALCHGVLRCAAACRLMTAHRDSGEKGKQ